MIVLLTEGIASQSDAQDITNREVIAPRDDVQITVRQCVGC